MSALIALSFATAMACNRSEGAPPGAAVTRGEPDYAVWNELLTKYYDPARGMDYAGLKERDANQLRRLRETLGRVDVTSLNTKEQLAYWINVYNVNIVGVVVEHYPVHSIREISSGSLIRSNVFKRPWVPVPAGRISPDEVEHETLRPRFKDPRIHFAINCAAKSCPPIRPEAYVASRVDAQLDDQVRRFVASPGVRIERRGQRTILHTTKIMKWFRDDFDQWGGGAVTFLRRFFPSSKLRLLPPDDAVVIEYDDYDWALNDWKRP